MKNKLTELESKILTDLRIATPGWMANFISGGKWHYPPHLALTDKLLTYLSKRKLKKLIINMPPRHGKSELISKFFPAWYLGINPTHKIILTSYEAKFAASFGRKVKDILTEFGLELFDIKINHASNSSSRFNILAHEGGMDCVGAGGAITGKGANLLIIDDPVKNDAQAHSITFRNNIWDWFNSTAFTRLEPDGIIIIIMTRWHEDDLCGRIFNNHKFITVEEYFKTNKILEDSQWLLVNFPAIAENNDVLGRQTGDVLWKDRFSMSKINDIKKTIGSYWFSSLYQQTPSPASGAIFKKKYFRYFHSDNEFYYLDDSSQAENQRQIISKEFCSTYVVIDLATTTKETSDYTVILVFALTANRNILILDIIRERFEGAEHINLVKQVYNQWKPLVIGIESVQYQLALIQSLRNIGLPIQELRPDRDKTSRALPMQARMEAGKVYFKHNAHWFDEFANELLLFPNAKHDDQVDAFAYISYMIPEAINVSPIGANINKVLKEGITWGF